MNIQGNKRIVIPAFFIMITTLFMMPDFTEAQRGGGFGTSPADMPDNYTFARVGEPTLDVVVMGTVRRPGNYKVREGTDLSKLFMYAGGAATIGERRPRSRPDVTLQISRRTENGRAIVFKTDFESLINGNVNYPALEDQDIIVVETVPLRPRFRWRDAASVISAVSTTLLIVDRFFYPLRGN